ncbi:hypothetical protein J6590_013218 [Homalodisca vitripennis]|nr:hypothetical protein J6590_013218 [Homalodisca vitripennis]
MDHRLPRPLNYNTDEGRRTLRTKIDVSDRQVVEDGNIYHRGAQSVIPKWYAVSAGYDRSVRCAVAPCRAVRIHGSLPFPLTFRNNASRKLFTVGSLAIHPVGGEREVPRDHRICGNPSVFHHPGTCPRALGGRIVVWLEKLTLITTGFRRIENFLIN